MIPIGSAGHSTPAAAIVRALRARADVSEVLSFAGGDVRRRFEEAGAAHVTLDDDTVEWGDEPDYDPLAHRSFVRPSLRAALNLERIRSAAPDVILFDPFSVYGYLAARRLGAPAATLVTFPGYASLGEAFASSRARIAPAVRAANERYRRSVGVAPLDEGCLPVFFPHGELSIVTTIASLSLDVDPARMPALHAALAGRPGRTAFVGPCVSRELQTATGASFPLDRVRDAQRRGRRVVLMSLGTVITGFRFNQPVGGAPTGCALLIALIVRAAEAFGNDPAILVVVSVGPRLDVAACGRLPENFLVVKTAPQFALLEQGVDAFVTHHGANSTAESLLCGVPMVSAPAAADQIVSARLMVEAGCACCLWDPENVFETCTAARLREAVWSVLTMPAYASRARALGAQLAAAGGAPRAAELVVNLARRRGE